MYLEDKWFEKYFITPEEFENNPKKYYINMNKYNSGSIAKVQKLNCSTLELLERILSSQQKSKYLRKTRKEIIKYKKDIITSEICSNSKPDLIYTKNNKLIYSGIFFHDNNIHQGRGTFYNSNGVRYSGFWICNPIVFSTPEYLKCFNYNFILKHGYGTYISRHTTYAKKFTGTFAFNKQDNGKEVKRTKKYIYYYKVTNGTKFLTKKIKIEVLNHCSCSSTTIHEK